MIDSRFVRAAAIGLLLLGVARPSPAQDHPAQWSISVWRPTTLAHASVTARLHAHIDQFWHLYSMTQGPGGPTAMRVALVAGSPFELAGAVRAPKPETAPDANFGIMTETYDDSVTLFAPVRAKSGAPRTGAPLAFAITYQTCTTRYCLPARTDTVATTINAASHAVAATMGSPESAAIARVRAAYFAADYAGGAATADTLLKSLPRSRELMAWRVANIARTNQPLDAVAAAKRLLAANRVDPWGWFATAISLEYGGEQSDLPILLDASAQALKRGPTNPDLIWLRALLLGNNDHSVDALALLDSVARRRPLTVDQINLRAFDLYASASHAGKVDTARRDSALALYARVRALDPSSIVAYTGPAGRLLRSGRTADAYALAKAATLQAPASLSVHQLLWQVIETMKSRSQAERDSEELADVDALLRVRGNEPATLQAAGSMFENLHLPARQAQAEERVLTRFPNTISAEWVLVNRYRKLGESLQDTTARDSTLRPRYRDALWQYVDRPTHLQPRLLGDAYRSLFWVTDSTTAADTLLRIARGMEKYEGINPHIIYAAGAIRLAQRGVNFAEAERLARAGIPEGKKKIDGQRAAYETIGEYATAVDWITAKMYDALGWVFFEEGRLDSAEVQLKHAVDLDPKSTDALFHLGQLAERQKSPAEAEVFYTRGSLVSVMGTNPNRAALEQLYRAQHGSLDGYPAYLAQLADADRARRKGEIEKTRAADPKPLRAFALHAVDGHLVTLDSLKGKVAVINNWGMWCGPCVAEMPELQKLAAQYAADSSVRILTIDSRDPSVDDLRAWLHKKGYTFETLLDDGYVSGLDLHEFPTTWVLDRQGRVVFTKVGWSEKLVEEFSWRIEMVQ